MTTTIRTQELPGMLEVRVTEKLTRADYNEFVPAIDRMIAEHGKVRILFDMHDFHGWTAGAVWSDVTFAIKHFHRIDRLAIVGENAWEKGMALFCKPFTRARIQYFDRAKIEAARAWVREGREIDERPQSYDPADAPAPIAELLRALNGNDGLERGRARMKLVALRTAATKHLIRAAKNGGWQLRLEATQALAAIADPRSVDALAEQLSDTFEISWAAAEGLKELGRAGAIATLRQLIAHPYSHSVSVSAHHALRHVRDDPTRKAVAPVIAGIIAFAPVDHTLVAASAALEELRGSVSQAARD